MSIKPFTQIVDEESKDTEKEIVEPFISEPHGGMEVNNKIYNNHIKEKKGFIKKIAIFFSSVKGLITTTIIFIIITIILDTIRNIQTLYNTTSILDIIYLSLVILLSTVFILFSYKNYKEIKILKQAKTIQEFYLIQKANPSKKIIPTTIKLLDKYTLQSKDKYLIKTIALLKESINNSHNYKEIYKSLDEDILRIIDIKAKHMIKTASLQAGISTAISPLASLDALIIIWRSFLLTKNIALLYGYKPNIISTIIILKRGSFNVFFAGISELAIEYANETMHNSILSKISTSSSQGIANAVLLARLGYGVMKVCRPLALNEKRDSFMKSIYKSLKKSLLEEK